MVIKASSVPELFAGALEGMNEYMQMHKISRGKKNTRQFKIESNDETTLLVDFLSEMLTLTLIERKMYRMRTVHFTPDGTAEGKITETPISGMETEIKAVTYHEAYCRKLKSGIWEAQVIFDI
jgi:SHS2 domain-containing protein